MNEETSVIEELRRIGASGPAGNVEGCSCPRNDETLDEGLDFPLCEMHQEMLRHLRPNTVALLFVDVSAKLAEFHALADRAAALSPERAAETPGRSA